MLLVLPAMMSMPKVRMRIRCHMILSTTLEVAWMLSETPDEPERFLKFCDHTRRSWTLVRETKLLEAIGRPWNPVQASLLEASGSSWSLFRARQRGMHKNMYIILVDRQGPSRGADMEFAMFELQRSLEEANLKFNMFDFQIAFRGSKHGA